MPFGFRAAPSSSDLDRKNFVFAARVLSLIAINCLSACLNARPTRAQPVYLSQAIFPNRPPLEDRNLPTPPALPPPEDLLNLPAPAAPTSPEAPTPAAPPAVLEPGEVPETIVVNRFEVVGSTVFSEAELAEVTAPFTGRPLSPAELYQVRSAITQRYIDGGYVNSGAYIPPQTLDSGIVRVQVIEGRLAAINVTGNGRLSAGYISSRLGVAGSAPLNVNRLLDGLRLLQLDPLIDNISAELSTGTEPGTSVLTVAVTVADTFQFDLVTDNGRAPAVGTWRRGVGLSEANLFGLGDALNVTYLNTDGSNEVIVDYTVPVSPRNATLNFIADLAGNRVIEAPFDVLDIQSNSQQYRLGFRQPVILTPTEELALGVALARESSKTEFLKGLIGEAVPFPTPGGEASGRTVMTALRFTQDWTRQGSRNVVALRSEFSFGIEALGSTINSEGPDSRFFSWRGQGQWVNLLASDTLLLLRGDAQVATKNLLPLEECGLGGGQTVRGYTQDYLLTDNCVLFTAEARVPVYRVPKLEGLLQVTPFVDFGAGWNVSTPNPENNVLTSVGVGLLWQQERLRARLDWGIPLISVPKRGTSLQANGIYFSIDYALF
jgi:hemolysin activation/secretion protein